MYAILDIETTGGQFDEEGITEIAIYKFDGHEITDQFISLVNPEIPIQPFVVKLTGITNAMLKSAPKFFEVAKRIIEITGDCVLVAHNATFDYRILRTEFRRLGYDFQMRTLCTVELAQKLLPEQPSYSLGKLVRSLGIPMADRHRATGDAMATVKLFKLLLAHDAEKQIVRELIKTEVEKGIEPKFRDIIESLPSRTGIYYVHREDGTIIYIGRSRNIKKHVNQHLVGSGKVSKRLQSEMFAVTFEETGSELVAILKENDEIRRNRPMYNRVPKRATYRYALTVNKDESGYLSLGYRLADLRGGEAACFVSEQDARNTLSKIAYHNRFCEKLTGVYDSEGACPAYIKGNCDGACNGEVSPEEYNLRVVEFLKHTVPDRHSYIAVSKGRSINERSGVVIENGRYKGYAFFDFNYQIINASVLEKIIVPSTHAKESESLIRAYLVRNKAIKIVPF